MIPEIENFTLAELAQKASKKFAKRVAFEVYRDDYTYDRFTYEDFYRISGAFAALLCSLGVQTGDRVILLSENSPEWVLAYFGIARAGAVSVPVLPGFAPEQIAAIIQETSAIVLCLSEKLLPKLATQAPVPLILLDSIAASDGQSAQVSIRGLAKILPLKGCLDRACLETDPASILYTSGTLGKSKAVLLSHRNLVWTARASRALMRVYPRDRLVSIIPLAHTYESTLGLLAPLMSGASIVYLDRPPSASKLIPAIQAIRPTIMVTVPLFIEKIYRTFILPSLEKNIFYKNRLTRPLAIQLAGRRLLSIFGGAVRFFGIGGAPLAEDLEAFLRKAQFPYAPGYGLTESSPLIAGTAPFSFPFRSAGHVLDGVEVRIAPDGEIQARGPNIMLGYYKDEKKTQEAFTPDGWLKTGDIGFLDKKKCLFIRGRLKSLILGPSGENIYPEEIECILRESAIIEEALVCAGTRGEIIALVRVNEKAQTAIAALSDTLEELRKTVNHKLASFSRINRIEIHTKPFDKTPTDKIKRF